MQPLNRFSLAFFSDRPSPPRSSHLRSQSRFQFLEEKGGFGWGFETVFFALVSLSYRRPSMPQKVLKKREREFAGALQM